MTLDEERDELPEVGAAPLIIDADFVEVEEDRGLP